MHSILVLMILSLTKGKKLKIVRVSHLSYTSIVLKTEPVQSGIKHQSSLIKTSKIGQKLEKSRSRTKNGSLVVPLF